jgi:hypothetical protein
VEVRRPNLLDLVSFEQTEAGSVDVRNLCAAKAIEHLAHLSVMVGRHVVNLQAVEFVHEDSKGSSRLLSIPMKEPGVGFTNNQIRCAPARPAKAKQGGSLAVPLVVAVQERNENSRIQKDGFGHGSDRP